jgi:hypothetical protein
MCSVGGENIRGMPDEESVKFANASVSDPDENLGKVAGSL